ncbi:MAG: ATP-binding protein [Bacteroidales bacterium]
MSGRKLSGKAEVRRSGDHDNAGPARETYRLAGGIAHDLNTILTTIYGYSEMALDSLDPSSEAGRSIQKIIEAADRARQLTARLLDLDRKSSEEMQQVKVSDILSDTLRILLPSAREDISLIMKMKSPDLMVEAIPSQLFRVFMNIAVNAFQAMEERGGSLTVTLDSVIAGEGEKPGNRRTLALISFADTGKGMDEATASRMFEPFFTEGGNRDRTGLGLAVVHDIVTEMNGTLKVRSERGRGTVIDLFIPVVMLGPLPEKS